MTTTSRQPHPGPVQPSVRTIPAGADHGADLAAVLSWLHDYVTRPHGKLGRAGPVCPFVLPALRAAAVQFSFRYDVDGSDIVMLCRMVIDEMLEFSARSDPADKAHSRQSRLVIMPRTGPAGWRLLDDAYPQLKDFAVGHGLMIGQFHPDCDERAVRNPQFPVSVSPLCLVAIRHMAAHDVLFLGSEPGWFGRYDELFGGRYARGRVRDRFMRERYQEAAGRYGPAYGNPPGSQGAEPTC